MTATIMSLNNTAIRWADVIEYPQSGVKSKVLLEDGNCRYALMSLEQRECTLPNILILAMLR